MVRITPYFARILFEYAHHKLGQLGAGESYGRSGENLNTHDEREKDGGKHLNSATFTRLITKIVYHVNSSDTCTIRKKNDNTTSKRYTATFDVSLVMLTQR